MNILQLFHNHLLVNSLLAWAAAQIIKAILYAAVHREINIHRLFGDGGMPSGHSATVTGLAAAALLRFGAESFAFAVSAVLAIIVMHDAMGVRWQAGQHARTLNLLLRRTGESIPPEALLEELLGHTPLQVAVGALLGAGVAVLYYLL